MRARRAIAVVVALAIALAAAAATAARAPVTVLPRPSFPPPDHSVVDTGPTRLALLFSQPRTPAYTPRAAVSAPWAPRSFDGYRLLYAFTQPGIVFFLYGVDGTQARVLVGADAKTHAVRYAFDFGSFVRPPLLSPGDAGLVTEQVVWARESGGVLYVETAHQTYAESSGGFNGYLTAVAIGARKILWRSPALVANTPNFVLAGDALVTGYGFTKEPDFLYVLDRRTGRVRDRLRVPSAPERIVRHGNRLAVRTYDHTLVVELVPR